MPVAPHILLGNAAPSDWKAIVSLLLVNKLPIDGAHDHLGNYVVACLDADVVGVAGLEAYGDVALLRSFAVAPAMQRQGIGRLLLQNMLTQARQRNIARLYLLTTTAAEYFEQWGFQRASRADAPRALLASAEFQGACPSNAVFMLLAMAQADANNP